MDESKIELVLNDQRTNAFAAKEDTSMKMLLYKFFFFNYTFQVTGPDIMDSIMTAESPDPLKEFITDLPEVPRAVDHGIPRETQMPTDPVQRKQEM
jgi:hypothetical protein